MERRDFENNATVRRGGIFHLKRHIFWQDGCYSDVVAVTVESHTRITVGRVVFLTNTSRSPVRTGTCGVSRQVKITCGVKVSFKPTEK